MRAVSYTHLDVYKRQPYDRGNGENTVLFIQHLQALNKDKKLIIIWDGASYHCCKEVQDYLNKINGEVEEKNWVVVQSPYRGKAARGWPTRRSAMARSR